MPDPAPSRVLVVDDDADACEIVDLLLKPHQIEVTCAPTPVEAWRLIKSEPFDLLMLDVRMPRLDGYEFCRQVREVDPNTPILFYSGAAYEADKQKGIAAGANAYVVKPALDELIDTTINLIAKRKSAGTVGSIPSKRAARLDRSPQFFNFETASD